MFSYQTEKEISNIPMPISHGRSVTLSAQAYNELLMAARRWDNHWMNVGAEAHLPPCPPCNNDGFGALAYESGRAEMEFRK